MKAFLLALGALWALHVHSKAANIVYQAGTYYMAGVNDGSMHEASLGWYGPGAPIAGAVEVDIDSDLVNNTGQVCYVYGAEIDFWFGGMNAPAGSLEADPGTAASLGAGSSSLVHYLQNVADLGDQLTMNGQLLLSQGSDHYDNCASLNKGVIWFPKPFKMYPGWVIHSHGHGHNGFQLYVGGSVVFNTSVEVYYTVGAP